MKDYYFEEWVLLTLARVLCQSSVISWAIFIVALSFGSD